METRTRLSARPDPYAGSFMYGTSSSPDPTLASPILRSSPLTTQSLSSPAPRRSLQSDTDFKSPNFGVQSASSRARRPPLSSVLDDTQHGSSPINDFARANAQYSSSVRFSEQAQSRQLPPGNNNMFGSPIPAAAASSRRTPFESALSVDDPFARQPAPARDEPSFMFGRAPQFASPAAARSPAQSEGGRAADGSSSSSSYPMRADDLQSSSGLRGGTDSSPALTLGQFVPSVFRSEAAWACWVIVYGYQDCAANNDAALLERFAAYGVVERFSPSSGNWLFIKYESPIQAERAAAQNCTFFSAHTLLAVSVLTPRTAHYMNLQLGRDGSLTAGDVDVSVLYSAGRGAAAEDSGLYGAQSTALLSQRRGVKGRYEAPRSEAVGGEELYLRPVRRKSVCTKLMEYFFSY